MKLKVKVKGEVRDKGRGWRRKWKWGKDRRNEGKKLRRKEKRRNVGNKGPNDRRNEGQKE